MDPEVAGSKPVIHPIQFRFANAGMEANPTRQYQLPASHDSPVSHPSSQLFRQGFCHRLQVERPGIEKIDVGVLLSEARERFGDLDF